MTAVPPTSAEKLALIEDMIERFRWARSAPSAPEHGVWLKLKAIASDMRAVLGDANPVRLALEHQINAAARHKARIGFITIGQHQAIAEALMAHWSVVDIALRRDSRTNPELEQGEMT